MRLGEAQKAVSSHRTPKGTSGPTVFVTRRLTLPPQDGSSAYTWAVLSRCIEKDPHTQIIWLAEKPGGTRFVWEPEGIYRELCHRIHIPRWKRMGNRFVLACPRRWISFWLLRSLPGIYEWLFLKKKVKDRELDGEGEPRVAGGREFRDGKRWDRMIREKEAQGVVRMIRKLKPARVLFNYAYLLPVLKRGGIPKVPTAVLTHDVLHQRAASLGENPLYRGSHWTRERERTLLKQAGLVIAIQNEDAECFRGMLQGRVPVVVVPMPQTLHVASGIEPLEDRILFVGNRAEHNVEGLAWFFDQVWGLVRRDRPSARLRVVGGIDRAFRGQSCPEGVEFAGFVDDLANEYHLARCVIAPLLAGSGLKIKVVEALSHGKAVVTTPAGAAGFDELRETASLVTEGAEAMAEGILRCLQDQAFRSQLERAAVDFVESHLTEAHSFRALDAWLRS